MTPHAHNFAEFRQNAITADNTYYNGSHGCQIQDAFAAHGIGSECPPMSVSISGPSVIETWETATWVANITGGNGSPTYWWQWRRSCLEEIEGSTDTEAQRNLKDPEPNDVPVCEWYTTLPNTNQSYSMYRPQAGPIQIKVTVTRGSETATRLKSVSVVWGNNLQAESDSTESLDAAYVANSNNLPERYAFRELAPNPSQGLVTIGFDLPEATDVQIQVYDLMGREVLYLKNDLFEAGSYQRDFDLSALPSGIYLARVRAGSFTDTKRFVVIN